MLLKCRRFLHSAPSEPFNLSRTPVLGPSNSPQLRLLTPKIVDSVIANCPSDSIALSFFLWCARQRDFFHAHHSLDRVLPVVRRLTFRFRSVSGIVSELETLGCPKEAKVFLMLLRIYARGDMFIFAHEAFDEMLRRGFVPDGHVRNVMLDVLFKRGKFDAAMRFFKETQMPNFISFSIVLRNLCARGDWFGVREVLREMVRRGFKLNVGNYTVSLDFLKKRGRMREVFQLLGLMIVSGLQLSVGIWSILIDGLCQVGRVDLACDFLKKMIGSGSLPTVVTYTSVIKALLEAQMFDEASNVWDSMLSLNCNPDLVLLNVFMDYLSKAGKCDNAIKLCHSLESRKMKPDSYTLSSLLPSLASCRNASLLSELILELDSSADIVAYNSLVNVLCKSGFPDKALEAYTGMIARGFRPDGYSYSAVLSSLCKLGLIDCAVSFYHSIADSSRADAYVHSAILDGLVKERRCHLAVKLFREAMVRKYNLDVVSYTIAIRGYFRVRKSEEACNLFKQMKLLGIPPNIVTYNVMLSGLCRNGDITAVKQLLEEMKSDGFKEDSISHNTLASLWTRLHGVSVVELSHLENTNSSYSSGSESTELLVCSAS